MKIQKEIKTEKNSDLNQSFILFIENYSIDIVYSEVGAIFSSLSMRNPEANFIKHFEKEYSMEDSYKLLVIICFK